MDGQIGDASSGLAIFMGPKEIMKQCLGGVFVGCFGRFGHFWRIGFTAWRRVLWNAWNDLLVFRVPGPA